MQTVDQINWKAEVIRTSHQVPILVNFSAPWCGLCRILHPLLNQFAPYQAGQLKLVNINTDENLKLANTFKITTLPTLLLIVDGEVVQRFERFHDRDDLCRSLEQITIPASVLSV